jgi:hypothetical protein
MRIASNRTAFGIAAVLLGSALTAGCIGEEPCTNPSGFGVVSIPAAQIDSVESITAEGAANCRVLTEVDGCDAGVGCIEKAGGVMVKRYYINARDEGACIVTVRFSNGCPARAVELTFGGPSGNCCANTCERSGSEQLPEDCHAN